MTDKKQEKKQPTNKVSKMEKMFKSSSKQFIDTRMSMKEQLQHLIK